ncbi:F0F1 ATP synthase subunit B [Polycladidibacter hongkongensis]|uniref:F0F1 ATP synthase subunit B n=1 Tax=Polycladidibacter hongkongensis TaxID=1647556 RepID=UPI0008307775|nr:F0F1 ATP synthase subunit B [Pseudovibrio hongkongensis]
MSSTSSEHQSTGTVAHGGEAGGAFPPFDSTTYPSQLLWLAITFGLFYLLMSKVVLPRIGGILEDRRDRIAGDMAEASRLKQESEAAVASYEQALADARAQAGKMAREAADAAKASSDAARTKAEAELADKLAKAEESIDKIKQGALAQVGDIAAQTTQELVKAAIGGEAPSKDVADKAVAAVMK